eukprot:214607-Rhodomonas_salina.1
MRTRDPVARPSPYAARRLGTVLQGSASHTGLVRPRPEQADHSGQPPMRLRVSCYEQQVLTPTHRPTKLQSPVKLQYYTTRITQYCRTRLQ